METSGHDSISSDCSANRDHRTDSDDEYTNGNGSTSIHDCEMCSSHRALGNDRGEAGSIRATSNA